MIIKTPKGKREIGPGKPTFVIAELSGNHNQDFKRAIKLVHAAYRAGADAIKLQTYTADTMTLDSEKPVFKVGGKNNPKLWQNKTLYDLYKIAYTPWEWQPKLKAIADNLGIPLFSTPFDATAVDFLERMGVEFYKVASYEINDIPLLEKIAKTGKPVIISNGYASLEDLDLAVKTLRSAGAKEIAVLYCVTGYATVPDSSGINLRTIADIAKRYKVVAGFSDNNAGVEVPVLAVAAGANIVEKHLTLSRKDGGPDARFSIEPAELKEMIKRIREAEGFLGSVHYGPLGETEKYNQRFRRSLFAAENIKKGDKFTAKNTRSIRPAEGLHTKYYKAIIGKMATSDIERGTPLTKKMVKGLK